MKDKDFLDHLTFEPLTRKNWDQFLMLFGSKGACGNCWCMYYRKSSSDFNEGKQSGGNKDTMKQLVWEGKPTGFLGFYEGRAIAWCAFAPREDFIKLEKSRVHKRIDGEKVWAVPCLFIDKQFRNLGVSGKLLKALTLYAKENGIKVLEAYPVLSPKVKLPDAFAWTGVYPSFERAGFRIVDTTSKNRPMVRFRTE